MRVFLCKIVFFKQVDETCVCCLQLVSRQFVKSSKKNLEVHLITVLHFLYFTSQSLEIGLVKSSERARSIKVYYMVFIVVQHSYIYYYTPFWSVKDAFQSLQVEMFFSENVKNEKFISQIQCQKYKQTFSFYKVKLGTILSSKLHFHSWLPKSGKIFFSAILWKNLREVSLHFKYCTIDKDQLASYILLGFISIEF